VRLCRLTVWEASSGRSNGHRSSGRNDASESEGGNAEEAHGDTDT